MNDNQCISHLTVSQMKLANVVNVGGIIISDSLKNSLPQSISSPRENMKIIIKELSPPVSPGSVCSPHFASLLPKAVGELCRLSRFPRAAGSRVLPPEAATCPGLEGRAEDTTLKQYINA